MSIFVVDSRNPPLSTFHIETCVAAFNEYVSESISRYLRILEEHQYIPRVHGIVIPSSPDKVKIANGPAIRSSCIAEVLRPRHTCVGSMNMVRIGSWANILCDALLKIDTYLTSVPKSLGQIEILIFTHDVFLFGANDIYDNSDSSALHNAVMKFAQRAQQILSRRNIVIKILCARTSASSNDHKDGGHALHSLMLRDIMMILTSQAQGGTGVKIECFENSRLHLDFELKHLLRRVMQPVKVTLDLPAVGDMRASLTLSLQGATLEACSIMGSVGVLSAVCRLARTGLDPSVLLGRSILVRPAAGRAEEDHVLFSALSQSLANSDTLLLLQSFPSILHTSPCRYWALVPPASNQTSSVLESIHMVMVELCDQETFLCECSNVHEPMGCNMIESEDLSEARAYTDTCILQICEAASGAYNPLAFPSGRYSTSNTIDRAGSPQQESSSTIARRQTVTHHQQPSKVQAAGTSSLNNRRPPVRTRGEPLQFSSGGISAPISNSGYKRPPVSSLPGTFAKKHTSDVIEVTSSTTTLDEFLYNPKKTTKS